MRNQSMPWLMQGWLDHKPGAPLYTGGAMGKNYSQRDLDERIELSCRQDAGYSLRKIGSLMSLHK